MSIIYYADLDKGGIAEYSIMQANALAEIGEKVIFLCNNFFPIDRLENMQVMPDLITIYKPKYFSKLYRGVYYTKAMVKNINKLIEQSRKIKDSRILFATYREYMAPIWYAPLMKLKKQGTIIGSILHDPIRDHVVGPLMWHRLSVRAGFKFLSNLFLHYEANVKTYCQVNPHLKITIIPHGPYFLPPPEIDSRTMRKMLNIPENTYVILHFGHLRDDKNLELIIRALANMPKNVYLIVAGSETGTKNKPASYYMKCAADTKVSERIRWIIRYVNDKETANLFNFANACILAYRSTFRSASGVMSTAISRRKLCLASSGDGPIKQIIEKYKIGIWIEPDNEKAIVEGIAKLMNGKVTPEWEKYEHENSWAKNAILVSKALKKN